MYRLVPIRSISKPNRVIVKSKMVKTYKLEFRPTKSQRVKISRILGTCRFLYNHYIWYNKTTYEETKQFITGYDFDRYINNNLSKIAGYEWIKECSSKARKDAIMIAERVFKKFFKIKQGYPRYKKKNSVQSYFFIKNHVRRKDKKLKVPILGWLHLKECNYLKKNFNTNYINITSGRIVKDVDKYYVVLFVEEINNKGNDIIQTRAIGVDVGIKHYATIFNGAAYKIHNINKSSKIKIIEEKIKINSKIISNKIEVNKRKYKKKKGVATLIYSSSNIQKLRNKNSLLYRQLRFIREDYIKKLVYNLVKTKPEYIAIEDLSISRMLQDKYPSKHKDNLQKLKLSYFKSHLIYKCKEYGVELRLANKYYPSSKRCSKCGHIEKGLKLSDRTYVCVECGMIMDRDDNAAVNLLNCTDYTLA